MRSSGGGEGGILGKILPEVPKSSMRSSGGGEGGILGKILPEVPKSSTKSPRLGRGGILGNLLPEDPKSSMKNSKFVGGYTWQAFYPKSSMRSSISRGFSLLRIPYNSGVSRIFLRGLQLPKWVY